MDYIPKEWKPALDAAKSYDPATGRVAILWHLTSFGVIVPGQIEVSPKEIHFTEVRIDASFSITPRITMFRTDLHEEFIDDIITTTDGWSLTITQPSTGQVWAVPETISIMLVCWFPVFVGSAPKPREEG